MILASLYSMEAPIRHPSFIYFISSPDAHLWKQSSFLSPVYDRYMSILHCCMLLTHPPPRPDITFSYRIIFLSSHTKKKNRKSNTRLPRRLLSFQSVHSHTVPWVCRRKSVYTFSFFIFSLIYCHIHISCILLHCYCTGPDYSGGVKRRDGVGVLRGGRGEEREKKAINISNNVRVGVRWS